MSDTLRVLYVDDEPGLLEIGKIFLETSGGFTVDTLTSATEALTLLATERYDAIISDYQMPEMDGIAFLKQLKASGNPTPFIIFTGRGREEVVIDALNNGSDFYLQKGGEQKAQFTELSNKIRYAVTRRRAEETLESVVNTLTLSQQVARVGNWTLDLKNQVFDASEEGLRLFGYPAGVHPSFQDIAAQIYPDDRPMVRQALSRLIETGEPYTLDIRIFRHDTGEMRVIQSKGQVLIREQGKPVSVFGINLDITDRKHTEDELLKKNEELNASYEQIAATEQELRANLDELTRQDLEIRESGERYRQFFKTTLDSVFMTTPDGQWVDCNDALVEIFGYESREEVFRTSVPSFYAHPEERSAFLRIVERDGFVREHPMQFRKKDGTIVDGLITIVPWKNPDGSLKGFIGTVHDITRRKEAERKLQESENRYRHIFESLEDLYYQTDMDGLITVLSPSVHRLSGYTPGELIGKPATDLYANPSDRAGLLEKIAEKGYVRDFELLLRKKDGIPVPVSVGAVLITHPDGTPAGIAGTLRDITDRKRVEDDLRESEEKHRILLDESSDPIFSFYPDGTYRYVNRAFAEGVGKSVDQITGKKIWDVFPKDEAEKRFSALRAVFSTGVGREIEVRVPRPDADRYYLTTIVPVRDDKGSVISAICSSKEITTRKQAEAALADRLVFQQVLIDSIPHPVFIKDATGRFVGCNLAYEQEFRTTRDYLRGKMVLDLEYLPLSERQRFHAEDMEVIAKAGRSSYELPIVFADGLTHMTLYSVDGFSLADGRPGGLIGMLVDITDRKQMEEALRTANKKLHLLSEITRHDISNQLVALNGYIQLSEGAVDNPARLREVIAMEQKIADVITSHIRFTRDYEDLGMKNPVWQEVSTLSENSGAALPMGDIRLEIGCPGLWVLADPLLEKVFYNLIDNSLHYGGEKMTGIRITAADQEGVLHIRFEDDGNGISENDKKQLFTRGYGKHTGLGLFLSREILSITGITIMETSEPGEGARFEIIVPKGAWRIPSAP